MALQHLRSLQALDIVLQTGSLKAAASILLISPAAVGQRIKTLEDYLGLELIMRGRSGLKPSAELETAAEHLRRGFAELALAAEKLELQKVNEIHIAANSDWVDLWLTPRLSGFRSMFPNVLFCINGEGDIPARLGQIDCEISFDQPADGDNCVVLFHDVLAPVGTRKNNLRVDRAPNPAFKLDGFPLLHLDFYRNDPHAVSWPDWVAKNGFRSDPADRGIRFQSPRPAIEAVLSDAGFVICGLALLQDRIENGDLHLTFPDIPPSRTASAFYARYRRGASSKPAIRAFKGWLEDEARKTRDWLCTFTRRK